MPYYSLDELTNKEIELINSSYIKYDYLSNEEKLNIDQIAREDLFPALSMSIEKIGILNVIINPVSREYCNILYNEKINYLLIRKNILNNLGELIFTVVKNNAYSCSINYDKNENIIFENSIKRILSANTIKKEQTKRFSCSPLYIKSSKFGDIYFIFNKLIHKYDNIFDIIEELYPLRYYIKSVDLDDYLKKIYTKKAINEQIINITANIANENDSIIDYDTLIAYLGYTNYKKYKSSELITDKFEHILAKQFSDKDILFINSHYQDTINSLLSKIREKNRIRATDIILITHDSECQSIIIQYLKKKDISIKSMIFDMLLNEYLITDFFDCDSKSIYQEDMESFISENDLTDDEIEEINLMINYTHTRISSNKKYQQIANLVLGGINTNTISRDFIDDIIFDYDLDATVEELLYEYLEFKAIKIIDGLDLINDNLFYDCNK